VNLPAELQQAVQHPIARVRLGAVEELEQLLGGDHAGLALAARATLERLGDDDSQSVSSRVKTILAAHPPGEHGPVPGRTPAPHVVTVRPTPAPSVRPTPAPSAKAGTALRPERAAVRPAPGPAGRAPGQAGPTARPTPPERRAVPPRPGPWAAPAGRRRRPGRLALAAVSIVVVLAIGLAVEGLRGGGSQVAVGRPFSATSPWRLQVEGSRCAVTVADAAYGQAERRAYGSDFSLQMRGTGEFVVNALTRGCTAAVETGSGGTTSLPLTMAAESDGAGGDSRPFRSPGAFTVAVSGTSCQVTVHEANDGSSVAELSEGDPDATVSRAGEFYVSSDFQCTLSVASGDREGG
jgi:hypothetical protein